MSIPEDGGGAEHFNRNTIAVRLPMSEMVLQDAGDFMAALERAEDIRRHPWKAADRNPMPRLDWWPVIDRVIWWRTEAPQRIRDAIDVLRDGLPDRDDW